MSCINLYNNRFQLITNLPNIVGNIPPGISIIDRSTGITHKMNIPYSISNTEAINKEILKIVESTRENKLKYLIEKYDNTNSSSK